METKICTKCGRELLLDQFNWRNKAKGTRRSECRECHCGFMKDQYQKKKDVIQSFKKKAGCKKCGYNKCEEALEFHHINPEEKDDIIARMISNNYSLDKVEKEMQKCVVLCANCHREFYYLNKNQQIILEEFLNSPIS